MNLTGRLGTPAATALMLARVALTALVAFALARVWMLVQLAPEPLVLSAITVSLPPGQRVEVVGRAIGAPGVGAVQFRRDAGGNWKVRSVGSGTGVKLRATPGLPWVAVQSVDLVEGQSIGIGGHHLAVEATSPALRLRAGGRVWTYDGTRLLIDTKSLPACQVQLFERSGRWLAWVAPSWFSLQRPVELGGAEACDNRLSLSGTVQRTALIERNQDTYRLQVGVPSESVAVCTRFVAHACQSGAGLADFEGSIGAASDVLIGRTAFHVDQGTEGLTLRPHRLRMLRLADQDFAVPPEIARDLGAVHRWRMPASVSAWSAVGGAIGLALAVAVGFVHSRKSRRQPLPWGQMLAMVLCAAWLGGAVAAKSNPTGVGLATAAASVTLAFLLIVGLAWCRRGSNVLVWWGALAAIGLVTQLELGLSTGSDGGVRGFVGGSMVLSLAVGIALLGLAFASIPADRDWHVVRAERGVALLVLVAICGLLAQAALGGEAGVWGFQPVELAKLALVAGTAHSLALHYSSPQASSGSPGLQVWISTILPIALMVALVTVALAIVDDYSPLLLLVFSVAGFVLGALVLAKRFAVTWLIVGLAALAVVVIDQNRAGVAQLAGQIGLYADRLNVWHVPAIHPHTGEQFLRGRLLGLEGGLFGLPGADSATARLPWSVPAIHDDFAPSFLLMRYGLAGGLLTLLLQAGALAALLFSGLTKLEAGAGGGYRARWLSLWAFFSLWGGFGYLFGHWVVSWGMNLGFLPVMGQPMSLISVAGSHTLLFIFPLLAISWIEIHPVRTVGESNGASGDSSPAT